MKCPSMCHVRDTRIQEALHRNSFNTHMEYKNLYAEPHNIFIFCTRSEVYSVLSCKDMYFKEFLLMFLRNSRLLPQYTALNRAEVESEIQPMHMSRISGCHRWLMVWDSMRTAMLR
jgi:hypothetical protein